MAAAREYERRVFGAKYGISVADVQIKAQFLLLNDIVSELHDYSIRIPKQLQVRTLL
jgi:hypothetical protein